MLTVIQSNGQSFNVVPTTGSEQVFKDLDGKYNVEVTMGSEQVFNVLDSVQFSLSDRSLIKSTCDLVKKNNSNIWCVVEELFLLIDSTSIEKSKVNYSHIDRYFDRTIFQNGDQSITNINYNSNTKIKRMTSILDKIVTGLEGQKTDCIGSDKNDLKEILTGKGEASSIFVLKDIVFKSEDRSHIIENKDDAFINAVDIVLLEARIEAYKKSTEYKVYKEAKALKELECCAKNVAENVLSTTENIEKRVSWGNGFSPSSFDLPRIMPPVQKGGHWVKSFEEREGEHLSDSIWRNSIKERSALVQQGRSFY